jgi:hypothetical protein
MYHSPSEKKVKEIVVIPELQVLTDLSGWLAGWLAGWLECCI